MRAKVSAILYDIHGNTDALEAVLTGAEAAARRIERGSD
jgi:hypothetical protein